MKIRRRLKVKVGDIVTWGMRRTAFRVDAVQDDGVVVDGSCFVPFRANIVHSPRGGRIST